MGYYVSEETSGRVHTVDFYFFQKEASMNQDILKLFKDFLQKQETLSRLSETERLYEYGYSELHIIAAIGDLEAPNVTSIAEYMDMTRGGVSKIIKKLTMAGLVNSYQQPGNNQKVFYQLTESGQSIYEEHDARHKLWENRDGDFLSGFSEEKLNDIASFMKQFNEYLDKKIVELGG